MKTKHLPERTIALWFDHHIAHFVIPSHDQWMIESVESDYERKEREPGQKDDVADFGRNRISNNEYGKHNRLRNELKDYYKSIEDRLVKAENILLFGPGTAKDELFNLLMENKSFDGKRISVESADKMTENQLIAFADNYFTAKA
ncbi:MAG TPA: hypothetical protein VFU15_10965 [Bacteroidia bacterium]|nr:hypothetical protein [Bacteroidia bacterium]